MHRSDDADHFGTGSGSLFWVYCAVSRRFFRLRFGGIHFFGLAYAFREGGHIRVTLVIQRLPERVQHYQETFILIFAFLLVTFMSFYCAHMVWESYDFEEVTHGYIPIPLWIPQVPVALGMFGLNLAVLDNLILTLKGQAPTYKAHEGETE